jgi:hypothetical protein
MSATRPFVRIQSSAKSHLAQSDSQQQSLLRSRRSLSLANQTNFRIVQVPQQAASQPRETIVVIEITARSELAAMP